jgi:hypothetical protein
MTENTNRKTQQIGRCRPLYKQDAHELKITLVGHDGQWSTTLELDTRKESPAQFLIFELPTKATGEMRQVSNTASEFLVHLAGATAPAKVTILSNKPKTQWMLTMFQTFAKGPGIAVLVKDCRVSVTMHEG